MGVTNLVLVSSEEDDSCESETVALGKAEVLRAFFVPLRLGDVLSEAFVVLSRLLTRVGIAAVAGLASALFCVLEVAEALTVEFFRVLVELARDVVLVV